MKLTYIYHDCFLLTTREAAVVFDFWRDPFPHTPSALPSFFDGIPEGLPVYVLVSHHHKDHFTPDIFAWDTLRPGLHYVLSHDTARFARHHINPASHYAGHKPDPAKVTVMRPGDTASLPGLEIHAYGSTDIGVSYVVKSAQLTALHAGDLNAWIWKDESTPAEIKQALDNYRNILHHIAEDFPVLDAAMFPVDSRIGTDYWTGAAELVRAIDVARFFPMHFELADSPAQLMQRHLDAQRFDQYANPNRGEYIGLSAPGATYISNMKQ